MPESTKDVIALIESQHREVKRLLTAVAIATGPEQEDQFCELRRRIAVHEAAEEEVVYPVLGAASDAAKAVVADRKAEEAEGVKVLAQLESMTVGSAEFISLFEKFRSAVLEHAEAEEASVLPLLKATQKPGTLQRMAEEFEVAENAAPTHAHPHAGTSATAHVVTGPALAIMDHVRDALHQNR